MRPFVSSHYSLNGVSSIDYIQHDFKTPLMENVLRRSSHPPLCLHIVVCPTVSYGGSCPTNVATEWNHNTYIP